jgi:hypothetical protein
VGTPAKAGLDTGERLGPTMRRDEGGGSVNDEAPGAVASGARGQRGAVRVHLLHIGKTGGTVLKHALEAHPRTSRFAIVLHDHGTRLRDVPEGEKVVFFLRDPLTRFVSGFYSRQRKGRPRHDSPWSRGERAAFERFRSPSELAIALSSPDATAQAHARRAMWAIHHLRSTLIWLESERCLASRLPDIFYIGFQETLNEDFERLKQKLGLPAGLLLSDDEVVAHKNPAHLDYRLGDLAVTNLRAWYRADQRMLDFCRAHAAEVNARPAHAGS